MVSYGMLSPITSQKEQKDQEERLADPASTSPDWLVRAALGCNKRPSDVTHNPHGKNPELEDLPDWTTVTILDPATKEPKEMRICSLGPDYSDVRFGPDLAFLKTCRYIHTVSPYQMNWEQRKYQAIHDLTAFVNTEAKDKVLLKSQNRPTSKKALEQNEQYSDVEE